MFPSTKKINFFHLTLKLLHPRKEIKERYLNLCSLKVKTRKKRQRFIIEVSKRLSRTFWWSVFNVKQWDSHESLLKDEVGPRVPVDSFVRGIAALVSELPFDLMRSVKRPLAINYIHHYLTKKKLKSPR